MKKENNKKGFTLAELLIVVAIIAVMVAIAIPTFGDQLEKAREATDIANIRAAYADLFTSVMTQDTPASASREITLKQQVSGWQTTNVDYTGSKAVTYDGVSISTSGEPTRKGKAIIQIAPAGTEGANIFSLSGEGSSAQLVFSTSGSGTDSEKKDAEKNMVMFYFSTSGST